MPLTKEEIYNLKRGEVVSYIGEFGIELLYVNEVDVEKGVVSGEISLAEGGNGISIEDLVKRGVDVAKWGKGSRYVNENIPGFTTLGLREVPKSVPEDF
jgi:hypothetical protein